MERWYILLCSALITSGILSSPALGKELRKKALSGLGVHLFSASSAVLSGKVNLSFHFPSNYTGFSSSRTLSVLVYDNSTRGKIHTESVLLDRQTILVSLPCGIFDHPGLYRFKYRIPNSEIEAFISQTLSLHWGDILLSTPTNHTALTRFGSLWIRHNRKCLPKTYRDKVDLYYIKGRQKIFVISSYVRKLTKGKHRQGEGSWIRVVLPCEKFSVEGTYRVEYQTGFENLILAESEDIHVYWGQYLYSPTKKIFPCKNSLAVTFSTPECRGSNDVIAVYDKYADNYIGQRPAEFGEDTVFFPCTLFSDYVKEYCFRYVTDSSLTGTKVTAASLCLPSHPPGTSTYDGWSNWSSWGLCSSSCGRGKQHRYRFCLSVSTAQEKSQACTGKALVSRPCALSPCPVSACSCGCVLTAQHGMITSSPQLFPRLGASSCTWVISLSVGRRVRLWFDALKMDGDSIIIRDGNDSSAAKIVTIKDDKFKRAIISTGSSMYIFYWHNGRWTNGTRRGFTASYRVDDDVVEELPIRRKTLGKAEVTFLGVFIAAVLTLGVFLFIVFTKLRQQHKDALPPSRGSSSTSESTLRSMGTSSPLNDVELSSDPLKGSHNQRIKADRRKTRRKKTGRTEFLCDTDVPRCTCGEISEMDSASGSNSASDCSPIRANSSVDRVLTEDIVECDCPECLRLDTHQINTYQRFGAPEKKYYGDWMLTEMPADPTFQEEPRIYRHSCSAFV